MVLGCAVARSVDRSITPRVVSPEIPWFSHTDDCGNRSLGNHKLNESPSITATGPGDRRPIDCDSSVSKVRHC